VLEGIVVEFSYLAFPRLALRRSVSQTLVPPLAELKQLLSSAAKHATVAEGRSLVRIAALMVKELGVWVDRKAGRDLSELGTCYVSEPPSQEHVQLDLAKFGS